MNKCTFCGREDDCGTSFVNGYEILESCTDCKEELIEQDEMFNGEKIVRISDMENVIVTSSYNENSCRWETHFYDLETLEHKFTIAY